MLTTNLADIMRGQGDKFTFLKFELWQLQVGDQGTENNIYVIACIAEDNNAIFQNHSLLLLVGMNSFTKVFHLLCKVGLALKQNCKILCNAIMLKTSEETAMLFKSINRRNNTKLPFYLSNKILIILCEAFHFFWHQRCL